MTQTGSTRSGDGIAAPDPAATGGMADTPGEARPASSPTDTSLVKVLGELEAEGYGGQFMTLEGGSVRCLTCRTETPAADLDADRVRRLEGVSDPADMVMIVPVTCPSCGTKGALVAQFGPESSAADADVVAALPRNPEGFGGPAHTA